MLAALPLLLALGPSGPASLDEPEPGAAAGQAPAVAVEDRRDRTSPPNPDDDTAPPPDDDADDDDPARSLASNDAAATRPASESPGSADAAPDAAATVPDDPDAPDDPQTPPVDGLRPGGWALEHPREHYWVPNSWPVAQPCDFTLTPRRTCLVLGAEVFAGFRYDAVAGRRFSEFRVDRGELGTGVVWQVHRRIEAGATLRLEAIRSAGPQSLVGIDGDSLVVRLLEAYGQLVGHVGPVDLGARMGLVPERWIEQVQKGYDTRAVEPIPSERGQFFDRADVGASITASGWRGRVELDLQVVNGEGRAQKELNPGKNTTAMLTVRPLQRRHAKGPLTLAVHGGYRDGSLGVAALRNHRGAAAVTFASPWAYAGFEYAHALGYQARGDVEASALGVWASGHVLAPWLGLMAKYDRIQADRGDRASVIQAATAGVFSDLFPYLDRNRRRVRLLAVYQYEGYGDSAGPLPGTPEALDTHRFLLQLQARGAIRAY
ncbi:MAG: hypothetical protein KDK70_17380 [Myxococcales bacterium]|nr:hypothetical protein [Myxococcales bacterium]